VGLAVVQALLMCLIGGYEKTGAMYMIVLSLPIMLIGGGLEEAGWRYITFPELEKKNRFYPFCFRYGHHMGCMASAAVLLCRRTPVRTELPVFHNQCHRYELYDRGCQKDHG